LLRAPSGGSEIDFLADPATSADAGLGQKPTSAGDRFGVRWPSASRRHLRPMSDTYLRYVPKTPSFEPDRAAASEAEEFARRAIAAESVASRLAASVEFVDAGANWEGVRCSKCGADAEPWWGDAMSSAAEHGFKDLTVRARCCGTQVGLDELHYGWPVAFGRFVLEAANPTTSGLSEEQLNELGRLLGCPVREIKCRV